MSEEKEKEKAKRKLLKQLARTSTSKSQAKVIQQKLSMLK
nr:MAG TPA_asm: hypothetical protein [Caudoviricetes sp.]